MMGAARAYDSGFLDATKESKRDCFLLSGT